MKIPYSWLQNLVPNLNSPKEVGNILTGIGLNVESICERAAAPDDVVIVRIDTVEKLKNSSSLSRVQVSDGNKVYSVVCSAPGLYRGLRTALALPSAQLPGLDPIEARESYGILSEGMLCSPKELGLYKYNDGVIEFAEDVPLGEKLTVLWPSETVIELEITPNRADALSILGVARDLAAKLSVAIRHPAEGLSLEAEGKTEFQLDIQEPAASSQFIMLQINGVTVKPSPIWLRHRLVSAGIMPCNNIVDITNYVTIELGQPSHIYDRSTLHGNTIHIRTAREGELLTTLDGQELSLSTADLVIASENQSGKGSPVALAGVIGSAEHSVSSGTTSILLEVAHLDPAIIRKGAKRHKLVTEAHYRFERGVDPNLPPLAAARLTQLINIVGGSQAQPCYRRLGHDIVRPTIEFNSDRVQFLTGLDVTPSVQQQYLIRLGCTVETESSSAWQVTPPSWRYDLMLEEDLIEEVARLYGYEHIPETFPNVCFTPALDDVTHRVLRAKLSAMGLQEVMNYVFTSEESLQRTGSPNSHVLIKNPLSTERKALRTSLRPGLIAAALANRSQSCNAFFEIGRVFVERESERLGLLLQGEWITQCWLAGQSTDFFVLRALMEKLADHANVDLELHPNYEPGFHPSVSARVIWQGQDIGVMGRLHPEIEQDYEIGQTYLAEINLPLITRPAIYTEYSRQPSAERDLAVVAPSKVSYATLATIIRWSAGPYLSTLAPFDIYHGNRIEAGQQSIGVRMHFQHHDRALNDEEVEYHLKNIIDALADAGYSIRNQPKYA